MYSQHRLKMTSAFKTPRVITNCSENIEEKQNFENSKNSYNSKNKWISFKEKNLKMPRYNLIALQDRVEAKERRNLIDQTITFGKEKNTTIDLKACGSLKDVLIEKKEKNQGALVINVKSLIHRNRFPTKNAKLPLRSSCSSTHYVGFKIVSFSNNKETLRHHRFRINMLCYQDVSSLEPIFEIPLISVEMVARTCSELGPCLCLLTPGGVFQFQCQTTGPYNYQFWETQMTTLGVNHIVPHDLFVPTSTQPIGEGSFAKVYGAIHRITGKPVVIKRVPKSSLTSLPEGYLSTVHIEISILRKLSHPLIVKFNMAFEDECYYYIVLEKIRGGTLTDWLRQHKRMTEDQARNAMLLIFSVLVCLSDNNIVHRDLKLENLVLEDADDPLSFKIIDFGLAAYLGTPRMNMYCGSPGFVAPEIIEKQEYGTRADMFSAGVLLYTFLSGKTPFYAQGNTASETLYKNKVCEISFDEHTWKNVSTEAKLFISQLLEKNPHKRLSPREALGHQWITNKMYVQIPCSVKCFSKLRSKTNLMNTVLIPNEEKDLNETNRSKKAYHSASVISYSCSKEIVKCSEHRLKQKYNNKHRSYGNNMKQSQFSSQLSNSPETLILSSACINPLSPGVSLQESKCFLNIPCIEANNLLLYPPKQLECK